MSTLGLSIYREVTSGATTVTERTLCPVLVGRQFELATVEDALIDAARSDGGFVVISGDAGMGKTRLTTEAQGLAAKLGFTSLRGGCAPTDVAIPYLPLLEAAGNRLARTDLARVRELGGSSSRGPGSPLSTDGDRSAADGTQLWRRQLAAPLRVRRDAPVRAQ